jgi:hypothetical protein
MAGFITLFGAARELTDPASDIGMDCIENTVPLL